ncbi:MAG: 3-hydroxyacyl-ACP dehydratase FabZ [Gammaproteobacteria bacterium]|nr:3-hydroxyacyl-ACP dehydratase FabZ [Gammaproteobacteria bacterium]
MNEIDIDGILSRLPHRYPFLLVDRVLDFKVSESLVAIKNVSYNEPYFPGHFPNHPIVPGVIIVEALAQATGLLAFLSLNETAHEGTMYYLVGIDKARFKHPVRPGDQMRMEVRLERQIRGIYRFSGVALVGERVVASAEFMTTKMEVGA